MRRILMSCCLILLLLPSRPAFAGTILNTLQGYDDDEIGWSGGVDGLFSGSGGNTERILASAGARLQWRGGADRVRLQASAEYEESGREVTARNLVVHLRHNREFGDRWSTVGFVQRQSNPFQRLTSRWLLGAGLRCDLLDDDRGNVSLGATPMLEIERLTGQTGHDTRARMSVFVHAERDLAERVRLDMTGFWQPLFDDLDDWRAVGNVGLTVDMTGSVEVMTGFSVEDNARAPEGVKRTDWNSYAGVGVSF